MPWRSCGATVTGIVDVQISTECGELIMLGYNTSQWNADDLIVMMMANTK